jgi:hypothetical protein
MTFIRIFCPQFSVWFKGLNVTVFAYASTGRFEFTAIRRLLINSYYEICTASQSQKSRIAYVAICCH